jgi:hypothetical protein
MSSAGRWLQTSFSLTRLEEWSSVMSSSSSKVRLRDEESAMLLYDKCCWMWYKGVGGPCRQGDNSGVKLDGSISENFQLVIQLAYTALKSAPK